MIQKESLSLGHSTQRENLSNCRQYFVFPWQQMRTLLTICFVQFVMTTLAIHYREEKKQKIDKILTNMNSSFQHRWNMQGQNY
uniref:Transmembrane protein n=1 Tax=Medicago truncatula TaxID=3880 RepID=I3SXF9_MEDTR|nr:unknown [Medicago truncatula]